MRTAIVVFAKTLGLTPVKTRLAADIGQDQADRFYSMSVKVLKETLSAVQSQFKAVDVFWALAESDGPEHPYWEGARTFWTGEGNLGQRLNRVTNRLFETHEAVIMIGTDSPHLPVERMVEAIEALRENPKVSVVGPCTDGGFYLFGSTEPLGEHIWTQVSYSQSDTLEQLLKCMQAAGHTWTSFAPLEDVDYGVDLEPLKAAFLNLEVLTDEQATLLAWLSQRD